MRERHYTGFWRQGAIVGIATLIWTLVSLTGCKDSGNSGSTSPTEPHQQSLPDPLSVDALLTTLERKVQGASGNVQQAIAPHSEELQARTKEEVDKLFRWEYKVVDLPTATSATELEQHLAELGTEGWECFSIIPSPVTTRTTCKRRPKSALAYLKYIPGL
jgi:hypothetical protein